MLPNKKEEKKVNKILGTWALVSVGHSYTGQFKFRVKRGSCFPLKSMFWDGP
jgi:hypothetical protein